MMPPDGGPPERAANRVFWALVALGVLAALSAAVGLLVSGFLPASWSRVCAMLLATLPPAARAVLSALALLGLIGGVLGANTLAGQIVRTRRLLGQLDLHRGALPPDLDALSEALGLGGRVDVVEDGDPYAFSYGWWRPRVAVSRGLLASLDPDELRAVLLHERYHVERRGAIRLALVRSLARALFFLPLAADLARSYAVLEELAADRFAVRGSGDRWALAAALVKVCRPRRVPGGLVLAQAAGAAGAETGLSLRARQILSYPRPVRVPLWRSAPGALWSLGLTVLMLRVSMALTHPALAAVLPGWCPLFCG